MDYIDFEVSGEENDLNLSSDENDNDDRSFMDEG